MGLLYWMVHAMAAGPGVSGPDATLSVVIPVA